MSERPHQATRGWSTTVFTALLSCAFACASRPASRQRGEPVAPAQVASSRPAPPPVAPMPAPSDPCPSPGKNEISDDDTPSISGTSQSVKAGDWLAARGITKAAFRAWVRSRDAKTLDDFDADSIFDNEESCQTMTVGDRSEDALVCTLAVRTSIMRYSATAFVVRSKRIVPVLEVGYALPAMDWPDARWLDLQLTFSPGGREADLGDRGKPGTVLVAPARFCHEHVQRHVACEKAHREGAPLDDVCPRQMDSSSKTSFGHWPATPPASPMGGDRVELQGCAEALPKLDALVKSTSPGDTYRAEFREDRAFAVKSCNARGHYVWKGDRFVRSPTGGP